VEGRPSRPSARLKTGQEVEVEIPDPIAAEPAAEAIPLSIVFEDARLLVLDKPAGIVVHPGAGTRSGTLVNALLHHVQDLSGIGGVLRPGIVHRLDRGTSGLLVVAKDDESHRSLARQFAGRSVEKEYLALVVGVPEPREGTIDKPIARHPVHRQRMAIRDGGRAARSDYRVVEALDGAALVRVRIHTGRTHQIRVHLRSLGTPVAADPVYGGKPLGGLTRPALHAARLVFTHPGSGERLEFVSPLPPDIEVALNQLRIPTKQARVP
jgi:23S rRNA pseudouridine1911/1915/1917 synthase